MELKQVHKLIDAYFEGNTSLEEEKVLKTYFSAKELDPSLEVYFPYFESLAEEKKLVSSVTFSPTTKNSTTWIREAVIAASFLLGFYVFQQVQQPATPTPEELAFQAFKANMYMVSKHLNKGMEGMEYIETLNTTTNKYIKND